jgi:hypothetical protein
MVETKSALHDSLREISFYATEGYWTAKATSLRRYTLRLDGFVSAHASREGGELTTKPLTFSGKRLSLNFATSAAGKVLVELQDESGEPLEGFALRDCEEVFGDAIERPVVWKSRRDLAALAGKSVRIRFVLVDADLYAFRFHE